MVLVVVSVSIICVCLVVDRAILSQMKVGVLVWSGVDCECRRNPMKVKDE